MFRKTQQSLLVVAVAPLVLVLGCTGAPTAARPAASSTSFPVTIHAPNGTVRIAARVIERLVAHAPLPMKTLVKTTVRSRWFRSIQAAPA